MRLRKHTALSVATLVAAATLAATATPAQANPASCTAGREGIKTAWAYCAGGTGGYGVRIHVTHPNPQVGSWSEVGPCVTPGQRSEYTPYHNIPFVVAGIAYC
ncbi:hypothetical protein ACIBKY_00530 [Nonomuraea sp. NPDC050394]|uniref:hypothetical protein n=1 Tax=Nonomuraea sp. NPDC050394 TaxID=3364363 RepID=UPI0037B53718